MSESKLAGKPFEISKWRLLQAFEKVKANSGSAGVDGESIAAFEADLKGNLYKLWNRLSSGSYFPPPVREVEIPKKAGGVRTLELSVCPLWRIGLLRLWWPHIWSRGWKHSSILTPTATVLGDRRSTQWPHADSGAGETTGWSILISGRSSTPFHTPCC